MPAQKKNTHTKGSNQQESKTVEDKLSELISELEKLKQHSPQKSFDQIKQKKDCQHLEQRIKDLEAYKELSLDEYVTDGKRVGKIAFMYISDGGLPSVMVSWEYRENFLRPVPEQLKFRGKTRSGLSARV